MTQNNVIETSKTKQQSSEYQKVQTFLSEALDFKKGQLEVIAELCRCKGIEEEQFLKESVEYYSQYLLDNPDDMTEDMINRLRIKFGDD